MVDFYEMLGVSRTADKDIIEAAYRSKMKRAHPDHGGDPETAKCINEAHDVLSDAEQRAAYDAQLAATEAAAMRREAERRVAHAARAEAAVRAQAAARAEAERQARVEAELQAAAAAAGAGSPNFERPQITPWTRRPAVRAAWMIWGLIALVVLLACATGSGWAVLMASLFALMLGFAAYRYGAGSPIAGTLLLLIGALPLFLLAILQLRPADIRHALSAQSLAPNPNVGSSRTKWSAPAAHRQLRHGRANHHARAA